MRILALILALFLSACQTYHVNLAMKVESRDVRKLPPLEAIYENEKSLKSIAAYDTTHKINDKYATIFYREVEKNIVSEYGQKKGRIVLTPIFHQARITGLWHFTPLLTLWTANILGCPMKKFESLAELELRILDNKGNVIKKYASEKTDEKYVAFYWGFFETVALEASLIESYKKALADISEQIQNDYDFLMEKLK